MSCGSQKKEGKPLIVTLGKVISHDPSMVVGSTLVLKQCPTSGRTSLWLLRSAVDGQSINHLPEVYHTEDVVFQPDSTLGACVCDFPLLDLDWLTTAGSSRRRS